MTILTWDSLRRNCSLHKFPTFDFDYLLQNKLIHPCSHFWQSGNQELNEQPQNVDIGLLEDCREGHRSCTMERNDERAWETIQALSAANPTLINALHCCTDCLLQCYICDFVTVHCSACRPSVLYAALCSEMHWIICGSMQCTAVCLGQCKSISGQIGLIWQHCCPSPFHHCPKLGPHKKFTICDFHTWCGLILGTLSLKIQNQELRLSTKCSTVMD